MKMDEHINCVARRTRAKTDEYIKNKYNQLIQQGIFSHSSAKQHHKFDGVGDTPIVVLDENPVTQRKSRRRREGPGEEIEIEGEQVIGNGENEVGGCKMESKPKPDRGQHEVSTLVRLVDYSSDSSTENETHQSSESNSSSYAPNEDSNLDFDDVMDCADSDSPDEENNLESKKYHGRTENLESKKWKRHSKSDCRSPLRSSLRKNLELVDDEEVGQTSASNDYNMFEEFAASMTDEGMNNEQKQANQFLPVDDYQLPLNFSFKDEEDPPEKTEDEKMVEDLFAEMAFAESCDKIGSFANVPSEENPSEICCEHIHRLVLDEEVGLICTSCHVVVQEIRYIMPPFKSSELSSVPESEKDVCEEKEPISGGIAFQNQMNDSFCYKESNSKGTVWDMVPGVRDNIYPHQAEGLEFIWRNLEGTILLNELKDNNNTSNGVGGCIISHAPGTGKTRLAIVFIETYLKVFPKCRPVIIAPAGMLLTWEEEFKKWKVNFPFHILNKSEYSGKEREQAFNDLWKSNNTVQEKKRMVKLYSWYYKPSVLGISYNLYEKLAKNENSCVWGKLLLDSPGLVILDEGHTPRNERSQIWNTLLKLNTKKRIILSGTPFQNNFGELFNTLHLVRPTIVDSLAKDETFVVAKRNYLKMKSARANDEAPFNASSGIWDDSIKKLKEVIAPFVHVHTGSILQESLPGLIDSVIVLNPGSFQKQIIDRIERSQNILVLEHKLALVSVHPSLLSCCTLSAKEESVISVEELKKSAVNPSIGVKTRFIMELIRLCYALNERVLIFSQYIDPLALVKDFLKVEFGWNEGKQVLHMQGKMDQNARQRIIDDFNNPKSDAKVLLASIKCCSEGINLVGASRVVLLDVVWNPSVERQAISRAYRLGQKKVVYTYHLITAGTTEGGKFYRQAEKGWISNLVFSSNNKEKDNNDDHNKRHNGQLLNDKVLEELCKNNNLKEIFEKIIQPQEAQLKQSFGLGCRKETHLHKIG